MNSDEGQLMIRPATRTDARQIAEIIIEDWKIAYRDIIDSDFLDSMDVEQRYQRELQRYQIYRVAAINKQVLGLAWNEMANDDGVDCEIIALYVRYAARKSGIGRALFRDSVNAFKACGKKRMIIWCLKENDEAKRFYEKMGGKAYKTGSHKWGNREYDMISYLYRLDELPQE